MKKNKMNGIAQWINDDPNQFRICAMMAWGINPRMLTEDPEEVMIHERDNIKVGCKSDQKHQLKAQARRSDDPGYFDHRS